MMMLDTNYNAFAAAYAAGEAYLVTARIPDDVETPVSAMLKLGRDRANIVLLESVEGGETRARYSVIATDPDLLWRVRDGVVETSRGGDIAQNRFTPDDGAGDPITALRQVREACRLTLPRGVPGVAAGLFGFFGYEMTRHMERLPEPKDDAIGVPEALLMRPKTVIVFDAVRQDILLATPVWPDDAVEADMAFEAAGQHIRSVAETLGTPLPASAKPNPNAPDLMLHVHPNVSDAAFRARVEAAKRYITAGDIFQCVPSLRYSAQFELPPFALYRALRRLNPSPYMFYLNFQEFAVVGSSPEILVKVEDNRVVVRPIAGTRPRGGTPEADAAHEADLLADPKERAEHLMLLDLGRNDVGRAAAWGSVEVTSEFVVERYSHVMHIVSQVEGDLREGLDPIDALFAGFPAGTVSGAPKVRAMEIIHELEGERRGVYAGGVGYFSTNGDMDTCIALRTAVVKDGRLHVRAGAGVVYDSDPESERMETVHKASAVFRAAVDAGKFV